MIIYDSRFDSSPKIRVPLVSEIVLILEKKHLSMRIQVYKKNDKCDHEKQSIAVVVLLSGISYAWLAWEKSLAACWCIEFLRRRSASVSSRNRGGAAPRAMTFPRVRAVRMLAVRETATACMFSHHRRYDAQVDPSARCLSHPFPSRSDIRFDRFHGWSALVHYVLPSGTERFATHCHFSVREGSRFKIIGSDTFILLSLRKN